MSLTTNATTEQLPDHLAARFEALETLTTANLLEKSAHHYHLTPNASHLLESYLTHLETICTPTETVTITLERPITPGDAERAYCELLTKCQEVPQ